MFINTSAVTRIEKAPRKEAGWCDANGVEHAWEVQDYTLTTNPPQSVRICLNCGKREMRPNTITLPEWR